MTKIKDFVILSTSSIYPKENIVYNLYSLPAFDNEQKCEILRGKDIQSNKYIVPDKCILFNKLNVRFKRVWRIDSLEEHKLCSTEFLPLIIDETKVDYQYFFYLLISDSITNYLCGQNANTSGSHKRISPADLLEIPVKLPSMPEQKAIGKILSDIDRKIALNKAINHNLVAMAKQLYDYWFVQFDFPNRDGKPYKSSGGKMVWNEKLKREIPEGWEVKELNEIIKVKDGTHTSPKPQNEGYYLITSKHISENGIDFNSAYRISIEDYTEINRRSLVESRDILFSMIGTIGQKYLVTERTINYAIKNMALLKTSQYTEIVYYIWLYLSSIDYIRYESNVISGSIQKFMSLDAMRKIPILYNLEKILSFQKIVTNLFLQISITNSENKILTKQRDELLPLLMNGQVTVG